MPITKTNCIAVKKGIPKVLFYKRLCKSYMSPPQTEFVAFSTAGDKNFGELVVHKSKLIFRNDYQGDTLAIDFIQSQKKHNGLGSSMIEFAKNYSKRIGCNGYLVLKADSTLDKKEVPHIFYRKMGFTTFDKKIDKKLDSFIKSKTSATSKDFSSQLMFYPMKKKKNIIRQFITKFLNF